MIKVTRLNNVEFVINSDLIETLEATPDTVITFINGKKMVVSESVDEIINKVITYRKAIGSTYIPAVPINVDKL